MRFPLANAFLTTLALVATTTVANAQKESYEAARMQARRELAAAKRDFLHYWQIVYPRMNRDLDARIDLTEAEIRNYRAQIRQYEPFGRFDTGGAFYWPLQDVRMCLREAEWRLRDLRDERNNLIRFRTPEWWTLEQRVQEARVRVAQIEARVDDDVTSAE